MNEENFSANQSFPAIASPFGYQRAEQVGSRPVVSNRTSLIPLHEPLAFSRALRRYIVRSVFLSLAVLAAAIFL